MMDNLFARILELLRKIEARGVHVASIVHNNRIGLPKALAKTKVFSKNPQGTLDWRMHSSSRMTFKVWMDNKHVLLLSTRMAPIAGIGEVVAVPWRQGAERISMNISFMHLEYTTSMQCIDMENQLRATYSCQLRFHK